MLYFLLEANHEYFVFRKSDVAATKCGKTCFLIDSFIKSTVASIVKNKNGDSSDIQQLLLSCQRFSNVVICLFVCIMRGQLCGGNALHRFLPLLME